MQASAARQPKEKGCCAVRDLTRCKGGENERGEAEKNRRCYLPN